MKASVHCFSTIHYHWVNFVRSARRKSRFFITKIQIEQLELRNNRSRRASCKIIAPEALRFIRTNSPVFESYAITDYSSRFESAIFYKSSRKPQHLPPPTSPRSPRSPRSHPPAKIPGEIRSPPASIFAGFFLVTAALEFIINVTFNVLSNE